MAADRDDEIARVQRYLTKTWSQMTAQEQVEAIDLINRELAGLSKAIEEGFSDIFTQAQAPLQVHAEIKIWRPGDP